jgi:tetratricopeptide (TPR) repeat protein
LILYHEEVRILLLVVSLVGAAHADVMDDPDTDLAKRLFKEGGALYEAGQYDKALDLFQRAKVAKPLPAFDYNIALCHDRLGHWSEALAAYERFAATSKNADDVSAAQARIPVLKERLASAGKRAAADDHYKKAVVHFNSDAYSQAAAEFKLAYDSDPDPIYLYSIGQSYRMANDSAEAIRFYEEFLKALPGSPQRPAVEQRLKELRTNNSVPAAAKASRGGTGATGTSERHKPIADLIKANRPGFRACFDAWAAKHPQKGGQVTLSFFLDPDGVLNQVEAQPRGFDAPDVSDCIAKYARTLAWPASPNGKYTRFSYPFDFKPN